MIQCESEEKESGRELRLVAVTNADPESESSLV